MTQEAFTLSDKPQSVFSGFRVTGAKPEPEERDLGNSKIGSVGGALSIQANSDHSGMDDPHIPYQSWSPLEFGS